MKKIAIVFVVLIVGLILLASSAYTVNEGEYVCIRRFSKIIEIKSSPGLNFKMPFLDSMIRLPNKQIAYDLKASNVLTRDKKDMLIDNYVIWKISDPLRFITSVTFISEAEKRIDAAVYNSVKNTMGTLEQNSIINKKLSGREMVDEAVTTEVGRQLSNYGIEVLDVKIKRLDLPPENESAVHKRMISEREKIAEQYRAEGEYEARKIKNEVDKEASILISEAKAMEQQLIGEGEAEYIRILSEAYSDDKKEFYEFVRTIDAMKKSLQGDKTIILPIDSPITRYFIDPNS
ncbi:UNVERIFIED_CONTAM: protease FtsH subunit HflC [Acetivibrio alkalicellulosi]